MRVVLDTNILISACLKPAGLEAAAVTLAIGREIEACATEEVRAEYRDVLLRDKFRQWRDRAENLIHSLDRCVVRVTAHCRVSASTDEDDNRFLECAEASAADYLVTGNLRHYPAAWAGTQVVNARTLLERIRPDTSW